MCNIMTAKRENKLENDQQQNKFSEESSYY